jgi:glycosyltransferase involved in cell wall biosynthesis
MRIVIINDYATVQGGAAKVAIDSAIGLSKKGYDVAFIYGSGDVDNGLKRNNIACIKVGQYDLLGNPSSLNSVFVGIWNWRVKENLDNILSEYDRDTTIVHLHSWVKALSVSVIYGVINSGFRFVLTLHDYFSICPNGGLYNYQKKQICHLKPMSVPCLLSNCDVRNYYHKIWRFFRQVVSTRAGLPGYFENFISVSDLSESLIRPYISNNARMWRIPNPINIKQYPPAKPSLSGIYTYIGRLSKEKGVALLSSIQSDMQSRLRIVGIGEMEGHLKRALPRAQFCGWCDNRAIQEFLDDTRALIFPSMLYETQGLVVQEAAARGVPSVVSDVTAASEFISDGETGFLFKSGDQVSLSDALYKLDSSDELVKSMGRATYVKYWTNAVDVNRHVDMLLSCYKEILSR